MHLSLSQIFIPSLKYKIQLAFVKCLYPMISFDFRNKCSNCSEGQEFAPSLTLKRQMGTKYA